MDFFIHVKVRWGQTHMLILFWDLLCVVQFLLDHSMDLGMLGSDPLYLLFVCL